MTNKHTQGIWAVGDSGEGYNRYAITTLKPVAGQRGVMTIALCAGEENARLIAAAPELLAALELAERYLNHPDVKEVTKHMALSGEVVNQRVSAAISKATGE